MTMTQDQIAALCRQLALLLHAGIGVADGVFLLSEEETGEMRALLQKLGSCMDGGKSLSEAMTESGAFPGCVTGMVHVGEQAGRLEEVLTGLAAFYEQRSRSIRQIRQALLYPAMILALMLVVIGVLLVKVLPIFDGVYASLGSGMTGVAAGLLHLGQLLERALPVLFALLAVAVLAVLLYALCGKVRTRVNGWYAARFGDRGIARKFNNANFARALAMGIGSGLPLEVAAETAGKLLADIPEAAARCARCGEALRNGKALQEAMAQAEFLQPAQCRMLAVGLRQGCGDQVMADIADRLLEEAQESLEKTVSKIEPTMVLAASVLVGLILLTVMLPLMNILSSIG